MKFLKFLLLIALIAAAAFAGWYFGRQSPGQATPGKTNGERKVAFYQSPMHPWIKSDKPGNCTICGMKLTPVYEGEKGFDVEGNIVSLSESQHNVMNVQTDEVQIRPLEKNISVAGRIEADETKYRVLSAYFDGRIEKLFVNFVGAEVKAGEPLAAYYSPGLLTAEQELATLLAQAPPTNSARLMAEHQRLIDATRRRLQRLGLTAEQVGQLGEKPLSNLTSQIVAPISGTVINRAVFEGQYVKEGDKLFEIADLSTMWFRFDLYEQDLPWISLGQIVDVRLPALPGKVFRGEVKFIDPTLNEATRSAKVRVELDNPVVQENGTARRLLYNNLYAQGQVTIQTDPVLAVNRRAVLQPGDQPRVYVEQSGAYEQRIVQLGRKGDNFWEILEGLSQEEKVVTEGNLMIDAQAELNRGAQGGGHQHTASAADTKPAETADHSAHTHITPEQRAALDQFLDQLAIASDALAADDFDRYKAHLQKFPGESLPKLEEAFSDSPLKELVEKISQVATLGEAGSIDEARKKFLPFSNASSAFVQELRKHAPVRQRVFKCPMYPKIGQTGYWVQNGTATRNPYYGAEMLDCGSEVK